MSRSSKWRNRRREERQQQAAEWAANPAVWLPILPGSGDARDSRRALPLPARPASRTIPWPPSGELRTAIETAIAGVIEADVRAGTYCCGDPETSAETIVRAVLDVIGGEA